MDLLMRALPLALLLTACTSTVEVQTTPVDVSVPALSVGTDAYVEVAIDIPPHPQGDITIEQIEGAVKVVNPTLGTAMTFSLRLSTEGTATPETPAVFTPVTLPTYYSRAAVLLPVEQYAGGTQRDKKITASDALKEAIKHPRIWVIVGNKVSSLGLTDSLPVQLELQGLTFNVLATKGFGSIGGATEVTGL